MKIRIMVSATLALGVLLMMSSNAIGSPAGATGGTGGTVPPKGTTYPITGTVKLDISALNTLPTEDFAMRNHASDKDIAFDWLVGNPAPHVTYSIFGPNTNFEWRGGQRVGPVNIEWVWLAGDPAPTFTVTQY